MEKPSIGEVKRFVSGVILPLYDVERDMPLPVEARRYERVAEHSSGVALLACGLAQYVDAELDVGKVCQFALVHDVIEIKADDTSIYGDPEMISTKEDREEQALAELAEEFSQFPWLIETIKEYERKDTPEALYVCAIDKLLAQVIRDFDGGRFFHERQITREIFNQRMTPVLKKVAPNPVVEDYFMQLLRVYEEHPELFYPSR